MSGGLKLSTQCWLIALALLSCPEPTSSNPESGCGTSTADHIDLLLLPPSPPAEKSAARRDQTRQSGTGDGAGDSGAGTVNLNVNERFIPLIFWVFCRRSRPEPRRSGLS
jgi:hypothetical protein